MNSEICYKLPVASHVGLKTADMLPWQNKENGWQHISDSSEAPPPNIMKIDYWILIFIPRPKQSIFTYVNINPSNNTVNVGIFVTNEFFWNMVHLWKCAKLIMWRLLTPTKYICWIIAATEYCLRICRNQVFAKVWRYTEAVTRIAFRVKPPVKL